MHQKGTNEEKAVWHRGKMSILFWQESFSKKARAFQPGGFLLFVILSKAKDLGQESVILNVVKDDTMSEPESLPLHSLSDL